MLLPHLAARIFNTPLLIAPGKLDAIVAGLGHRLGLSDDLTPPATGLFSTAGGEMKRPGYLAAGTVAVIDVFGVLAHRGRIEADSSYIMGYQEVARMMRAAEADPKIEGILLNIDSPGGEAAGAFDMSALISRSTKPVWAAVSDLALSGGYLLAAGANKIGITQTGMAGSIGVVMRHVDASALLAKEGVKITHIFAGSHKLDGNPYEPLPDSVRAEFQRQIDGTYDMFVAAIAKSRGITQRAVRETEAAIYTGQQAIDVGLADVIATPDQMISDMSAMLKSKRSKASKGAKMEDVVITQEMVDAARHAGLEAGRLEGRVEGATAERTRIQEVEAQTLPGHEPLIASLKYDGITTGAQAAIKVLQAEKELRGRTLHSIRSEAPSVLPLAVPADPDTAKKAVQALPVEERCQEEWKNDAGLRAEFSSLEAYVAYSKAMEAGKVRILGTK